jgi:hypothetical protein
MSGALFVCLLLLVVALPSATASVNPFSADGKCQDGSYCSGASYCCSTKSSSECCQTGNPCCDGEQCCESDELTCSDAVNGCVCCETQFTFCCSPNPGLGLPSRCCPRFSVCCDDLSRFGCCSPGVGEVWPLPEGFELTRGAARPPRLHSDRKAKAAPPLKAYGLIQSAWLSGGLLGVTVDISSGVYTSVPANGFPTGDEIPRLFTWNGDQRLFHCALTNWSTQIPPGAKRPVVMWTVNPTTGVTSSNVLSGVFGQSTGFAYEPTTKTIIVGTADIDANQTRVNEYKFWSVSPRTFAATLLLRQPFANGVDSYAGWFHNAMTAASVSTTLRLGNIDPTIYSSAFGLSETNLSAGGVRFTRVVPPSGMGRYQSLSVVAKDDFISLGSSTQGDPTADLDVVRWSPGKTPKTLATLGNAHRTPIFGPLAEAVNGTTYVAFVVQDSIISNKLDSWALAVVDINSGNANTYTLSPFTDGQTDSVAGIGLA